MQNQLSDEITISLHFTDLQEIDDTLTNDDARRVLCLIRRKENFLDTEMLEHWINYFKSI